jgi:uncharacterized protein
MPSLPTESDSAPRSVSAPDAEAKFVDRYRWVCFVLPLAVYMLAGSLEPTQGHDDGGKMIGLAIPYSYYPWLYTAKIALTLLAMGLVFSGYRRFPFRVSPLALVVGTVGVVVWIALAKLGVWLHISERLLAPIGLADSVQRPGFDPFQYFSGQSGWMWAFIGVRLLGLAAIVPVIEEFFLRGFLMRFVMAQDWWDVPIGKVNAAAIAASILVPVLSHPGELLATAAWFGMVTWLMVRTRNLWDCVAAHAVTNLLLGLYVLTWKDWLLW